MKTINIRGHLQASLQPSGISSGPALKLDAPIQEKIANGNATGTYRTPQWNVRAGSEAFLAVKSKGF